MTGRPQRLWVFSDLHQEWPENAWDPAAHAPPGGFDAAVVAGDVHTPLTRALDWLAERLLGVPVVYVPGNQDFWWDRGEDRYTIHDQIARGRDLAARHGIHLLMDDTVMIGGTRFAGGTLWTDFRLGSTTLTQAMRSAQGRFGMVDYRRIRTEPRAEHLDVLLPGVLAGLAGEAGLDPRFHAPIDGVERIALRARWRGGSLRRLRHAVEAVLRVRERTASEHMQ